LSNSSQSNYVSLTQRVKLAQELHDGIAQDLVGLGYGLDALLFQESDEVKRTALRSVRFDINTLIEKVRSEILELRSQQDENDSLGSQPELAFELTRVFNEIISNVSEHSQATRLDISFLDNGIGGAQEKENHFGLQGISERVAALGGHLEVQSDFTGTNVCISLDLLTP
jgi:two-component system, NarL family, sensor histidine kinase LiaS